MKYVGLTIITFFMPFTLLAQSKTTKKEHRVNKAFQSEEKLPKLGIALYTFHSVTFPEALTKVDMTGLKYIEGFSFQNAGPAYNNAPIMNLSPAEQEKLYKLLNEHGLKMISMYVVGDNTIESWKKEFELAKTMHLKFVTGEPPLALLNSIDSLAGLYKIRLAIHEHYKGMSAYWQPDSVLAALVNHPNLGVCADVGHWPKSGINPVDALQKLAGHIIAVHFKDIAEYNNTAIQDVPLGTGVIDFPEVFKELKRQKFKGYIYLERDAEDKPDNLQSVLQGIKYYNSHSQIMTK